jgi:hypothetical protein
MQKKKKKGHSPAHQNKFGFIHNLKSKLTAKILDMPIFHVCRRCNEKLEWRKQYRKYKPRTQPGTCNGCKKRNVLAAYHTICESCTIHSDKAKELIHPKTTTEEKEQTTATTTPKLVLRACAMCVKELALPDPEEEEDDDLVESTGRIRLREQRTIERKLLAKEAAAIDKTTTTIPEEEEPLPENTADQASPNDDNDNDEDDPFLKAVGGADKLLTGEAYQQKLLEENQSN